jgi:hypothetical protein
MITKSPTDVDGCMGSAAYKFHLVAHEVLQVLRASSPRIAAMSDEQFDTIASDFMKALDAQDAPGAA